MTQGSARPRTCDHPEVEDLGADGIVEFYACRRCHEVIVVQGTRRWVVAALAEDT